MASFADYTEFVEPLALPYRGKVYEIPPVGIADTVRLGLALEAAVAEDGAESEHALSDDEFEQILLGSALEQMRADNVPPGFVQRVLTTAIAEFRSGRAFAEMVWATGGAPKAMEAWIAERQASPPSSGMGEANETPTPASTTGTKTSRPKQPQSKVTGTAASGSRPGRNSSTSGRSSKPASTPTTESTSPTSGK